VLHRVVAFVVATCVDRLAAQHHVLLQVGFLEHDFSSWSRQWHAHRALHWQTPRPDSAAAAASGCASDYYIIAGCFFSVLGLPVCFFQVEQPVAHASRVQASPLTLTLRFFKFRLGLAIGCSG